MRTIVTTTLFFFFTTLVSAQMLGGPSSGEATIQGKVFRKDGETKIPIAGAILGNVFLPEITAVSDENGYFTLVWPKIPGIGLFARTDDLSLVGFGKFTKEGERIEIELVPAASFKGRLLHPQTGEPLVNVVIGRMFVDEEVPYINEIKTDNDGRFAANGFIPGKQYHFRVFENNPEMLVGVFLALDSGEFDAGDITVVPMTPKQLMDYIRKPFPYEESPTARFEKTLQQSKESKKPVLVLFVHVNDNLANTGFAAWVTNAIYGLQGREYLAGYEYLPVDMTNLEQASELAERLGVKLPDENKFAILVYDSDGKIVTRRDSENFNAPRFKPDGELELVIDPVLLLTFLKEFGINEK